AAPRAFGWITRKPQRSWTGPQPPGDGLQLAGSPGEPRIPRPPGRPAASGRCASTTGRPRSPRHPSATVPGCFCHWPRVRQNARMAATDGEAGCVFCDIVAGRGPASVVYSDESVIAFLDLRPLNTGHLLVVPQAHAAY